jgi:hypothetical protein
MGLGECLDPRRAGTREAHTHHAVVVGIGYSFDEPGRCSAVDELDDAVVAQQQVTGDFPDRRRRALTADREQELVLGPGEPDRLGLILAPPLEPSQAVAKGEQSGEVCVADRLGSTSHIV